MTGVIETMWTVIEGEFELLDVEEETLDVREFARREQLATDLANLGQAASRLAGLSDSYVRVSAHAPDRIELDRYWFRVGSQKISFAAIASPGQPRKPALPPEFVAAKWARAIVSENNGKLAAGAIIFPDASSFYWGGHVRAGRLAMLVRYLRGIGYFSLGWGLLLTLIGVIWQLASNHGDGWPLLSVGFVGGLLLVTSISGLMLREDWVAAKDLEEVLGLIGFPRPTRVDLRGCLLRKASWKAGNGEIDWMYRMPVTET